MPHEHNDHCGHESHEHDHNHDSTELGFQDNLYLHIDRQNAVTLNSEGKASDILKPWHERLDENKYIESDADDQLIIRIPFTGSVRLRALLLKSGPGDQTPSKIALFANEPNLDFEDVSDRKPTQEFNVPQGREVGEYAVKTARFSNISGVTLFIPSSQGADTSRIYYLGFLGSWTAAKQQPIITVYEAQANLADHEKIQGMDGTWSAPGL
ncbi:galactose-binding domain-like protein [Crepidotus variabilis]|uniref:Galactose-binding domain-like protein n=1 Tax=Crepidotus variabilis TaxID=179855 RepID=A0A9P6JVR9_9AGAR|nr:galactose-binding domain-like protein [Crepidotus variabilis]